LTANRLKVWKFIRDEIGLGHKFVYPDTGICKDGFQRFDGRLWKRFTRLSITGLFHFYYTERWNHDKDAEMKRFSGKTNIMVATTVIEVGGMFLMLP
jgi:RecG-like helicase